MTDSNSTDNPEQEDFYWCFISYRHRDNTEEGRQWATWLHQSIETYEVPEDLIGTKNSRGDTIPGRIFPVFRDEDELPADADLASPIYRALDGSLVLLVLCSPQAVASTYVANEIHYFKKIGKSDSVLAALIEGEPNASWDQGKWSAGINPARECFPTPLQHPVDSDGNLVEAERAEPIAADFRLDDGERGWTSTEAYRRELANAGKLSPIEVGRRVSNYGEQSKLAFLKIVAGILGVPLGTLTKRDKAYQLAKERRRAKIFRRVAAAMMLLFLAAAAGGVFSWFQSQEAARQRDKAEEQEKEASRQRDDAEVQRAEAEVQRANAERQSAEAERQKAEAEQQTAEATRQRDAADAERVRANEEAYRALQEAYRSQLKVAAALIDKQEIAAARRVLLEVSPKVRRWEWAYLMSRCGATPRALQAIEPDGKWVTDEMLVALEKRLAAAPENMWENVTEDDVNRDLLRGERTIHTSTGGRGGGYAIIFQGTPPTQLFSYWSGMYASPGRIALSADGSVVAWECEYGEIGGRPANVWSGDLVLSEKSIAPVPDRIMFDHADSAPTFESTPLEGLLDPARLRFGSKSLGLDEFDPVAEPLLDDASIAFIESSEDGEGNTQWTNRRRNLKAEPFKLDEQIIHRRWPDLFDGGVTALSQISHERVAEFQVQMARRRLSRKFCFWVPGTEQRIAVLEGNGLELWDVDKVRAIRQICKPRSLNGKDGQNYTHSWTHDATPFGVDEIVGWLEADGERFLAIGGMTDGLARVFLHDENGDRIAEPAMMPYSVLTSLHASPLGSQICMSVTGRNEQYFWVWDAESGKQIISTDYEQPLGYGWPPDERFLALADVNGKLALYDQFGGKVIRTYPGVRIEGGANMPVRYSPDRSRILISNLLIDAETLNDLILLKPGTTISPDWTTIVSWVDEQTAEITSTRFWSVRNEDDAPNDLLWRDRLLLHELDGLDNG